jgi:hypothetical protein
MEMRSGFCWPLVIMTLLCVSVSACTGIDESLFISAHSGAELLGNVIVLLLLLYTLVLVGV